MLLINNTCTNPYFNIAAEEYLLKESTEDVFMLYVDAPSIIVGKHQNTIAEVNYRYVTENQIPVIRRISGGGTVYHDLGNLNFSFIVNGSEGHLVDFKRFTQPIIDVLHNLDIDARLEGKNDIRINGLKVSGNAEHVFKNRVLHHGTLLVLSDVANLSQALKVEPARYEDKAVKSIRSKVANINNFSNELISVEFIKDHIFNKIQSSNNTGVLAFSNEQIAKINEIAANKFMTWEWNYAYSPKYTFRNSGELEGKPFEITFEVENGLICSTKILGLNVNETKFLGVKHNASTLTELGMNMDLLWLFF